MGAGAGVSAGGKRVDDKAYRLYNTCQLWAIDSHGMYESESHLQSKQIFFMIENSHHFSMFLELIV